MDLPLTSFLWEIPLLASFIFLFSIMYIYLAPYLSLTLIPYIFLLLLLLRLLQFITHKGDTYKSVTQFKHFIRIFLFIALLTIQLGIQLNLISYEKDQDKVPFNLHKLALYQSKKKHIFVRYVFSFVIYFLIHDFATKQAYDGSNLHVIQAITEIIDFVTLFWEDTVMSLDIDYTYSPHNSVQDSTTEVKYTLASMKILATILLYNDFFILFIEVIVRYVLHKLFRVFVRSSQRRATRESDVIYILIAKKSISFFFCFLLAYKVSSDCLGKILSSDEFEKNVERLEKLKEIGDFTCKIVSSFFIMWIIKTYTLITWESHVIYDRLRSKILSVSKQLYFLGILDRRDQNIFNLQHTIAEDQIADEGSYRINWPLTGKCVQLIVKAINVLIDIVQTSSLMSLKVTNNGWRDVKRNIIKGDLLWDEPCDPTLYDMQQMVQYIVGAKSDLRDNYISAVLDHVESKKAKRSVGENLEQLIIWDREAFVQLLRKINDDDVESGKARNGILSYFKPSDKPQTVKEVSPAGFRRWVVKAHDNVISLGNTLSSAKEVTEGLNNLVSVILIGVAFVAWLKAFKYAETSNDFALMASPFFAATFLFKDTLKDSFERIFFVYVIHPFDIGDILGIEGQKMEVAAIGLWTTTFLSMNNDGRCERRKAIIYPNSTLAKIKITKHQTEFNFGDDAENKQGSIRLDKNVNKND